MNQRCSLNQPYNLKINNDHTALRALIGVGARRYAGTVSPIWAPLVEWKFQDEPVVTLPFFSLPNLLDDERGQHRDLGGKVGNDLSRLGLHSLL